MLPDCYYEVGLSALCNLFFDVYIYPTILVLIIEVAVKLIENWMCCRLEFINYLRNRR